MNAMRIAELVDNILVAEMRFLFALERDDGSAAGEAIEAIEKMLRNLHRTIEQSGFDGDTLEEGRAFYTDLLASFSAVTHDGLRSLKDRDEVLRKLKVADLDHNVTVVGSGGHMVVCHGKIVSKLRIHGRFHDGGENDFSFLCDPKKSSWVRIVQSAVPTYAEHGFIVEEIFGKVS